MIFNSKKYIFIFIVAISFVSAKVTAQLKLPSFFADHMVLQRDQPIYVWGWSNPNEEITAILDGASSKSISDANGKWILKIPKHKSGGPFTLIVKGKQHQIKLEDILIGDVWLASGQSNMEFKMRQAKDKYLTEISNANNPNIRQFIVKTSYVFSGPLSDVAASEWKSVMPSNINDFTAVGYFFAKELYKKNGVPIGIILSSLGGTPAEAWVSKEGLSPFPNYIQDIEAWTDSTKVKQTVASESQAKQKWYDYLQRNDTGLTIEPWYSQTYQPQSWKTFKLPGFWEEQGMPETDGVVWLRKEIELSDIDTNDSAILNMGLISDEDTTYINGINIGNTASRFFTRKYIVSSGLLKPGKNIITVRILNKWNRGGFMPGKEYSLQLGKHTISLEGEWLYKPGIIARNPLPASTAFQNKASGLYNGMISPLIPFAIKGVIWYQGEANTAKAKEYRTLFPSLIKDWRKKWNQGDFPFLFVQLANYFAAKKDPGQSDWAELREAQTMTLSLPKTGMAVISDIGEWNDVHPLNKEDVGKRLFLAAEKVAYGEKKIVYSGPLFKSMSIDGNKAAISFNLFGSSLIAKNADTLRQFAIAGADKKFVWAHAIIKGDKVIVWNEQIEHPVAVRYAWADNPEGANLYNKEGLPASSFRTDKDE